MDGTEAQASLLLLFSTERVAPFAVHFAAAGYDITDLRSDLDASSGGDASALELTGRAPVVLSSAQELERLGADLRRRLLRPQIVIHDVARDLIEPDIRGQGSVWRVDPTAIGQIRTEMVNWILERLEGPDRTLWVNVFSGEHDDRGGPLHCSGRYGLEGFRAALRLVPRLASLAVVNLCVTYFSDAASGAGSCPHCLTAMHASAIRDLGGDLAAAARYVEHTYRRLGSSTPAGA